MITRNGSRPLRWVPIVFVLGLVSLVGTHAVDAQVPQGATLTVVSGQTALVRANGLASQPVASGSALGVGDRIATLGGSTALVTFFEGSEIELGEDTTIILREMRSTGNEVHLTVEDVLGDTVSRVKAFVNPNSVYTVQNPGGHVVAVIRGSTVRFVQYETGGTLVIADCTRPCTVLSDQREVCQGIFFVCGIDPKGNVTNDPGFSGGVIDTGPAPSGGGNPNDSENKGTIGGE
jgi:hypothetical protein